MADEMVMVYDSEGNKFQVPKRMLSQFSNMGGKMRGQMPMGDSPESISPATDDEFSNKLWATPTPTGAVPSSDGMGEQKVIGGRDPRVKAEEAYQKLSKGRLGGPR
jgi:hypothetical protein